MITVLGKDENVRIDLKDGTSVVGHVLSLDNTLQSLNRDKFIMYMNKNTDKFELMSVDEIKSIKVVTA